MGRRPQTGATWALTQNLAAVCEHDTASPRFLNVALQDEFRPTDRWYINAGVRFESYGYALGNSPRPSKPSGSTPSIRRSCVDPDELTQVASTIHRWPRPLLWCSVRLSDYYTTVPGHPARPIRLHGDRLYHPGQGGVPRSRSAVTGTLTDHDATRHASGSRTPRIRTRSFASPTAGIRSLADTADRTGAYLRRRLSNGDEPLRLFVL